MTDLRGLVQVGVDHRSAPLSVLEALHRSRESASGGGGGGAVAGAVAVATCHRLELYLEGTEREAAVRRFGRWLGLTGGELEKLGTALVIRDGESAGRHLLRVAAGLESAVLGEDQILGQTRNAYRAACEAGTAGPLLHRLFHAAFRVGKRARTETALGQGSRSLAGAAVARIDREFGGLASATVLVVGTGEMAVLAARRLRERGVGRLLLTSRTWARAQALAAELSASALAWEWRTRALGEVDAVVSATRGGVLAFSAAALAAAVSVRDRRLVVVDLAVPRTVEPPEPRQPLLSLADVAGLSEDLRVDADRRREAVAAAEAIVESELGEWVAWVWTRREGGGGRERTRSGALAG